MRIKIRPADKLYSQWLRKERKYTCERCHRKYQEGDGLWGLHVSHFYGRANNCVRFDPRNTDLLCMGCHQYFTANPNEYVEWKRKRMGEREFKRLMLEAHLICKKDDEKIILWLKNL